MEEAFKMRNLLQEFLKKHGVRTPTILGLREHIFTGRYMDRYILLTDLIHSSYSVPKQKFLVCIICNSCSGS